MRRKVIGADHRRIKQVGAFLFSSLLELPHWVSRCFKIYVINKEFSIVFPRVFFFVEIVLKAAIISPFFFLVFFELLLLKAVCHSAFLAWLQSRWRTSAQSFPETSLMFWHTAVGQVGMHADRGERDQPSAAQLSSKGLNQGLTVRPPGSMSTNCSCLVCARVCVCAHVCVNGSSWGRI